MRFYKHTYCEDGKETVFVMADDDSGNRVGAMRLEANATDDDVVAACRSFEGREAAERTAAVVRIEEIKRAALDERLPDAGGDAKNGSERAG